MTWHRCRCRTAAWDSLAFGYNVTKGGQLIYGEMVQITRSGNGIGNVAAWSTLGEGWITAVLIVVLGVFSYNVPGQQTSDPPMRILYPCQIKIKAKGADFSYTYSYWVTADDSGKTTKVTPFKSDTRDTMSRFVYEEAFIECVKKWTLEPNGKYIVQFRVATMSLAEASEPRNYVLILGPGDSKQKLKMELPWSAKDTLVIPKEKPGQAKSKTKP